MRVNRLILREGLQALGLPGVAGLALLAFSLAFALSMLLPAYAELEQQRSQARLERARLAARPEPSEPGQSPARQLKAFYEVLPPQPAANEWLARIYAAAEEEQLSLAHGKYVIVPHKEANLMQYQIELPVAGTYSQIRQFVAAALNAVPALALEAIELRRQKISEPQLTARIRMSLYLVTP